MGTLQENQSLNAEYERNKKEREMQEDIEYLNYCNEQLEKTNKNLNYKVEKLEEDYRITCEQKNQYISTLEQGLNNAEQEIERLNNIINEIYTKALDTSITSLDLRDYIINNLGSDKEVKMKKFLLYLLRWQLSTPILALVLYLLHTNEIVEIIIANLVGGVIFFQIDKKIFRR